ncbi:cancer-associated 1 protein-like isoform X2, partial [Clarias magur]
MGQSYSLEDILKNTAEAIVASLKDGISSLNRVYESLIEADVDPATGQCSNFDYIREQIVQARVHLERSEQTASSELKSLDESLERLIQDEGKLDCEKRSIEAHLENLRTEQASNEKLLTETQGALELAKENLNTKKKKLEKKEKMKLGAEIATGVGVAMSLIPVIGGIA